MSLHGKHVITFENKRIAVWQLAFRALNVLGTLEKQAPGASFSRKSRNFSGLFRVPQFRLYLRNAEVPSHKTSQSSWMFLHEKHVVRSPFENKRIPV